MRPILLLFTLSTLFSRPLFAQLKPGDSGSEVSFKIRNFGFGVTGSLHGLAGEIRFNPSDPEKASFDVTVESATIETGSDMRDNHLKQADYFDVKNYPRIRFVSESVKTGGKKGFIMTGKLTIKGHSKSVSFPFTVTESGGGMLFVGEFPINRHDFGIGGSSTISNNLEVTLKVLAK